MSSNLEEITAPALKIKHLRKVYAPNPTAKKDGAKGHEALKDVSLTIPSGEFFAFLGPNGAGKSTLIGILSGLVVKTSGTAEVCGVSMDDHPGKAKSFIGLVPQEFNLNWFETSLEIVVNQAGYYGIPKKRCHAARGAAFERFRIMGKA